MSYKKISGPPNVIKFYYNNDTMFEKVQLKSMYRADSIKSETGVSMIDELGMTEDERDYYDEIIPDAVFSTFETLKKMVKTITDSVIVPDSTNTTQIAFSVVDRNAYDENKIPLCDRLIQQHIKNYVLKEWFNERGLADGFAKYSADFIDTTNRLIKALFELKKPLISG